MGRIFITGKDVMELLGCKSSKAYKVIEDVNRNAIERGMKAFPAGKANKYIFSEMYGVPVSDIDQIVKEG